MSQRSSGDLHIIETTHHLPPLSISRFFGKIPDFSPDSKHLHRTPDRITIAALGIYKETAALTLGAVREPLQQL
jgi:hypothetical protein